MSPSDLPDGDLGDEAHAVIEVHVPAQLWDLSLGWHHNALADMRRAGTLTPPKLEEMIAEALRRLMADPPPEAPDAVALLSGIGVWREALAQLVARN